LGCLSISYEQPSYKDLKYDVLNRLGVFGAATVLYLQLTCIKRAHISICSDACTWGTVPKFTTFTSPWVWNHFYESCFYFLWRQYD